MTRGGRDQRGPRDRPPGRTIRRRRGLSLDTTTGLAGTSKSYLSMLEAEARRFERRGRLEDLAAALGCSVADLTGQPYLPADRATADPMACLPAISVALHECSLTDVPDAPTRPVGVLAALAAEANRHTDETRYALAGRDLGAVRTELRRCRDRPAAGQRRVGHARSQARADAAVHTGRPEFLAALTAMTRTGALVLAFRTSRTQYRPPPWRFSAWCVGAGPVAVR